MIYTYKKVKIFPFLLFLLFIGTAAIYSGCKKDNPEDNKPATSEATLTANKSEVLPMEITTLKAENISLSAEFYDATIGGQNIKIGADNSNGLLAFLMPSLAEGNYEMKVTIEGKEYTVNYRVKAAIQVADPNSFINKAMADLTFPDAVLDNIHAEFKDVEGNEHSQQHITTIKQYTQSVKQTIAGLNEEEKKQLAAFISANPLLFSEETDPTMYIDSFSLKKKSGQTPEEIIDEVFQRMERDKNKLYIIAGLTIGTAYLGQPYLSAVCGLAGIYKIYKINNDNIAGLNKALVRFGELLADDIGLKKKGSMFTFTKDKKYVIKVRSPYRNPNKEDMNSTALLTNNVIFMLNEVGNVWQKVNNFTSKVGYKLEGSAFHIKNVNGTKSRIYYVDPQLIMVANISNPKVTGKWNVVPEGWEVEFTTEEATTQDFSFDIMYKSETGESVLKFDAKVSADIDSTEIYKVSAIGKYTVNGYVGNGPNSRLLCELKAGGMATYTIYDDPSWPNGHTFPENWTVRKINNEYFITTSFTNPGHLINEAKKLNYPVNSFVYRHTYVK